MKSFTKDERITLVKMRRQNKLTKRWLLFWLIFVAAAVLLIYSNPLQQKGNSKISFDADVLHQVLWVYDGDTIRVDIDGKLENIRLLGINTPEVAGPYTKKECFGPEASARAKDLLIGKSVRLRADLGQPDRDKYDRLLRYVYLEDGTFINELLLQEGYAHELTVGKPYSLRSEFLEFEKSAKNNNLGLWSACSE